jgi:hypothetical protein
MSKGDRRRPAQVPDSQVQANWDKIWSPKKPKRFCKDCHVELRNGEVDVHDSCQDYPEKK